MTKIFAEKHMILHNRSENCAANDLLKGNTGNKEVYGKSEGKLSNKSRRQRLHLAGHVECRQRSGVTNRSFGDVDTKVW